MQPVHHSTEDAIGQLIRELATTGPLSPELRARVETALAELDAQTAKARMDRARLQDISEALFSVSELDFERLPLVNDDGSVVDGLAAAVSGLSEKIRRHFEARKRTEETISRSEVQLRHAQKMEAVGRLSEGVAHDFNNMLSIILGYTAMLLDGLEEDDPKVEILSEVQRAAERSAELTRQLLAFSRRQVLATQVVNLNDVIASIDKIVRHMLGEDVELSTILEPRLCRTELDPGQIEQVIMNLVVNAKDAMPSGGELVIETSIAFLDEVYAADHPGVKPGRYVVLSVKDTGTGMDDATLARIFEPFFTTKPQGRGTGLGLATSFGIVQQSGGHISVQSTPGAGTTFALYFPEHQAAAENSRAERRSTSVSVRGSETVLLVEDDEQVRSLVHRILVRNGYRVLAARHPGEALLVCEEYKENIDLLLTDVIMPQMTGQELSYRLLAVRPEMRVLYMSGYTDDVALHGVTTPSVFFLRKPITPETLGQKVRGALDATRTVTE